MKKFVILLAVLALAFPLLVGSAFADSNKTIVYNCTEDGCKNLCTAAGIDADISLSKGVSLHYDSTTQSYGLSTGHMSGNKIYTTAFDTTLIYWKGSTDPDGADLTGLAILDSSNIDGSWTEM